MSIYVETRIRASMPDLLRRTSSAQLHQRWDLRFSSIRQLKPARDGEPQRFRYATRIGFGVEIEGWGETVGEGADDGTRTSALSFGSEDWRSLIRSGSGYWKYEAVKDGIRFLTGYDYEVRFGVIGHMFDRLVFRPLMGWATAWSFDRLRLWIEVGVDPRHVARQAIVHAIAASTVAFVWIWHGVVPKLAGPHPDELTILLESGVPQPWTHELTMFIGAAELLFGLAFVPLARRRWPWILTIVLMAVATVGVLASSAHRAAAAFNPITLNLLLAAVAVIGLLTRRDLPSAGRCLRRAPRSRTQEKVR